MQVTMPTVMFPLHVYSMASLCFYMCTYTLLFSSSLGTHIQEDGRTKCHRYFPRDEQVEGEPDYVQFEQVHVGGVLLLSWRTHVD